MLNLKKNKWHARLFFWALGVWLAFKDEKWGYRDVDHYRVNGTNLCFFFRTIMIWMPFVILMHLALLAAGVFVLIVTPVHWFGWSGYGLVLAGIAFVIAVILGIVALARRGETIDEQYEYRNKKDAVVKEEKEPSFFRLVGTWIISQKRKICPLIKFVDEEEVHA